VEDYTVLGDSAYNSLLHWMFILLLAGTYPMGTEGFFPKGKAAEA
jgi:hypothetical protein